MCFFSRSESFFCLSVSPLISGRPWWGRTLKPCHSNRFGRQQFFSGNLPEFFCYASSAAAAAALLQAMAFSCLAHLRFECLWAARFNLCEDITATLSPPHRR
eukprot:GHVT01044559.1.p1 GENE.GHVT01044559.1~~GHVT01044559.1.p1  ORF type:complete len:102 (+),score=7.65 GHVT01044559.1:1234-1539(+)